APPGGEPTCQAAAGAPPGCPVSGIAGPTLKWLSKAPVRSSNAPSSIRMEPHPVLRETSVGLSIECASANRRVPTTGCLLEETIPSSTRVVNSAMLTSSWRSRNPATCGSRASTNRSTVLIAVNTAAPMTNRVSGIMNVSSDQALNAIDTSICRYSSRVWSSYWTNGANEKANTTSVPTRTAKSPIRTTRADGGAAGGAAGEEGGNWGAPGDWGG